VPAWTLQVPEPAREPSAPSLPVPAQETLQVPVPSLLAPSLVVLPAQALWGPVPAQTLVPSLQPVRTPHAPVPAQDPLVPSPALEPTPLLPKL
jgi:hypothetical protein